MSTYAPLTRGLIITDANVTTIPDGTLVDNLAAYYNSGATAITVQGTSIAAGAHAVWAWVSGAWTLLASGTGGVPASLAAPTGLTSTPTSDGAALSWSAVVGAAGYVVKVDSSAWMAVTETSYIATGLAAGSHSWQVAATDANGTGAATSGTFVVTVPAGFIYTTDYFDTPTALATIDQTSTYDWTAPIGGSGWPVALATVENNVARSGGGGKVAIPATDGRISVLVSGAIQLRIYARGGGVRIRIDTSGKVYDDIAATQIGTATAGMLTVSLTVSGSTATVHQDGTLVGSTSVGTSGGDGWGFETLGASVYAVRFESATSGTPTAIPLRSVTAGTVLASEGFSGADAATVSARNLVTYAGGGARRWEDRDPGGGWVAPALAITSQQGVRAGTGSSASGFALPYLNVAMSGTLVALPGGGDTELSLFALRPGNSGIASVRVSPTAITAYGTDVSKGALGVAPQPGDVIGVSVSGTTATVSATRGGTAIGTPVTFTVAATRPGVQTAVKQRSGNTTAGWDDIVWKAA